jgi:hypothetical protein
MDFIYMSHIAIDAILYINLDQTTRFVIDLQLKDCSTSISRSFSLNAFFRISSVLNAPQCVSHHKPQLTLVRS